MSGGAGDTEILEIHTENTGGAGDTEITGVLEILKYWKYILEMLKIDYFACTVTLRAG